MSDDSTVMPGVTPSFAPEMRVEDLAAVSGFTVTALNKRRLVLSRIRAAPRARLGHLAFEGQGAFPSQC